MYSREELERFYFEYYGVDAARDVDPWRMAPETMSHTRLLDDSIHQLRRKVVEMQIDGKPEGDQAERSQTIVSSSEELEGSCVSCVGGWTN